MINRRVLLLEFGAASDPVAGGGCRAQQAKRAWQSRLFCLLCTVNSRVDDVILLYKSGPEGGKRSS
jgi:hypothetical protein